MAWSAKIISGDGGTQGVNEFEAVYDASTQTELRLKYNFSLGDEAPEVLYHTPDNGSPIPVRANGRNRLIFLTVHIPPQGDWDSVFNVTTQIARLIDGEDSQAVRAQIDGDVDKVKVGIKPDGATYTTYYDILHGHIDASTGYTSAAAILNKMGYDITIALTCAPIGYGDSFTLRNALSSSPHMLEDSNSDGLADNLTAVGTPTATIDTDVWLCGGQSQKIVTDDSTSEGVVTGAVGASIGTAIIAYVDVCFDSGDAFIAQLLDGGNNSIQFKIINAAGTAASKTCTSPTGDTFHRYELSGTISTAANVKIRVYRDSTSATQISTCYVDKMYLQGGTTAPPAFSSSREIKNRYDPDVATANINYVDVWGVPGDAPATMRIKATGNVTNAQQIFVLGKAIDGKLSAGVLTYKLECEDFTVNLGPINGSSSTPSDAGRHGGAYYRLTASGGTGVAELLETLDGDAGRAIATGLRRVYAICRSSSTSTRFTFSYSIDETTIVSNEYITPTIADEWEMHDMGVLALNSQILSSTDIPDSVNEPRVEARIAIGSVPSGDTADVDVLFFVPTKEFLVNSNLGVTNADPQIWFDGHNQFVIIELNGSPIESTSGSIWNLRPGQIMNRIMFLSSTSANEHTLTDGYSLAIDVIPRTRHLLGTL